MKNKELYALRDGINQIAHLGGADFSICVIKNLKLIEAEIDVIDAIIKPSKEFEEKYQPELEKIAREHCKKNEKGDIVPQVTRRGQAYYEFTPEGKEKFDAEVKKLEKKKEFAELATTRKKQEEKLDEILEKECAIKFNLMKREWLPADIKSGEFKIIYPFFENNT